ncbi:hypothetical protein SM871_004402 [Yersinia enterocolitica]
MNNLTVNVRMIAPTKDQMLDIALQVEREMAGDPINEDTKAVFISEVLSRTKELIEVEITS